MTPAPTDNAVLPSPPAPSDSTEAARWEHTRRRRRLLEGTYLDDLRQRLQEHVGTVRSQAWGPPDMSANPFRALCRELAVLYVSGAPDTRHLAELAGDDLDPLRVAIADTGLWAQSTRFQAATIACREYLRRVDVDELGEVLVRPVPSDLVLAWAHADRPSVPVAVQEIRPRKSPITGKPVWTWDVVDIADPQAPIYRIVEAKDGGRHGDDWTALILGEDQSGDAYPYRKADGTPILPYVLYHAEDQGDRLWDAYEGVEALEGALTLMVLWSMWVHVVRDASWPQRVIINGRVAGTESAGMQQGARVEVVVDPAVVISVVPLVEEQAVSIGQWVPGADANDLGAAIASYGSRLLVDAGVPPSDVERVGSDARSGYAISLTNDGKRAAQRRFAASFRDADERLIAVIATLLNRATGTNYPEDGYSVIYQAIPLSPDELDARRTNILELLGAGLMGPSDALIELQNGGITREQALKDLARIAEEKATVAAGSPGKASEYALLGNQTAAMLTIVESYTGERISRESAKAMLIHSYGKSDDDAEKLLGPPKFIAVPAPPPAPKPSPTTENPVGGAAPPAPPPA